MNSKAKVRIALLDLLPIGEDSRSILQSLGVSTDFSKKVTGKGEKAVSVPFESFAIRFTTIDSDVGIEAVLASVCEYINLQGKKHRRSLVTHLGSGAYLSLLSAYPREVQIY